MHPVIQHPVREIRTPKEHAKICEIYHNGSESVVLIKIRRKTYTFPLRYFITELSRDLPSGATDIT